MRSRDRRELPMPSNGDGRGLVSPVMLRPKRKRRRRARVEGEPPAHRNGRRARGGGNARQDGGGLGPDAPPPASRLLDEENVPEPGQQYGPPPQRRGGVEWAYRPQQVPYPKTPEMRRQRAAEDNYEQEIARSQLWPQQSAKGIRRGGKVKRPEGGSMPRTAEEHAWARMTPAEQRQFVKAERRASAMGPPGGRRM